MAFEIKGGEMLKAIFLGVLIASAATPSFAMCYGSGVFQQCFDDSGSSYTVTRTGNQTIMSGYNAHTGSQWSQDSTTLGGTTFISGQTNGSPWNETETSTPGMTTYSGTDSDGNPFYKTCTAVGCF
jgi:hypothetical protein